MLEVFKELAIHGGDAELGAFIDAATENLAAPWSRDIECENELQKTARGPADYQYAFARAALQGIPMATLFIIRDDSTLKVTNIVPREVGSLTRAQYNEILDAFIEDVAGPVADRIGVTIEVTDDQLPITHWLSEEAARRLRRFSGAANKGTGSSHPSDFKRWASFLIQAHRERASLDTEILRRWLIEEEGWPEEKAVDLAIEYEFARDLLRAYDNE